LLAACDVYRPAAIDQLEVLAKQEGLGFHADRASKDVPGIARAARAAAAAGGYDCVIYDTAGRLQIDDALVQEVADVRTAIAPDEVLLVADSALGQEAVNVARVFHERVGLTGIVMTKLDGDARGGAALSMKSVTGVPIKFAGTGEKTTDLEPFHPDRMASRILGMGDVVSLVEKAQETLDQDEQQRLAEKMRRADFDLEDFLTQMRQIKKLGSMESILKMLPGMGNVELGGDAEGQLKRTEAIILSMTLQERRRPEIINGSRRGRIARGSGTSPSEVNALLKQFGMMRKMMKAMKGKDPRKLMRDMRSNPSGWR
jgi:signal recognition particle subunit SRP54